MKFITNRSRLEGDSLVSKYNYQHSSAIRTPDDKLQVTIRDEEFEFRTDMKLPRLGLMMVGLGGNNGTTITGGILANKHNITWTDKKGEHSPNFLGSITQSSTMKVACTEDAEIYAKMCEVVPLVNPTDIVIGGWDISRVNLADAMKRAEVFDWDLQKKLAPYMEKMVPLPSIYYEDFIAMNQKDRADNILKSNSKKEDLEVIRKNIREFKAENNVDKVIVLWTANTERFCQVIEGVHDTFENLMAALESNHKEISASTVFAMASLLEDASFINGSPQNTFVPGVLTMKTEAFMVGNDFKTGQTKFKTNFIDFLLSAGIKPKSCISYNHLGNNDGKNLSQESQFKSKEASKSSCINDLLENSLLYPQSEGIDHSVVIKYLKSAGDSKKAIDEYCSEIFMDGAHTLVTYNVCEDSLLAAGVIIDLILLTELFSRLSYRRDIDDSFRRFDPVLSFLGYLMKAPEVVGPQANSLSRQRLCIENLFRVLVGLPIEDNLLLNFRLKARA